jgi:hypothetical protein
MNVFSRLFAGANSPSEDRTESILQKHLDGGFKVFPMAEDRANPGQIEAIGKRFGVKYPPEIVAHICGKFPGIYIEVVESLWPRPKANDVGPFWSFLYAVHTYTSVPDSEPWMRISDAAESFQKGTGLTAAPVLRLVGDRDLYCVDATGKLVQFRHEENVLEPVRISFWALFEREVAELVKRKHRKKAPESGQAPTPLSSPDPS